MDKLYSLAEGYVSVTAPGDRWDATGQVHISGPEGKLCGEERGTHDLEYGSETCPHLAAALCASCQEVGKERGAITELEVLEEK